MLPRPGWIAVLLLVVLAMGCGSPAAAPPPVNPDPSPAPAAPDPPAAPEPDPPPRMGSVPILMYHEVGEPWSPWEGLFVRPEEFRSQMEWLAGQGYQTVSMAELAAHWLEGLPLPERPIVLTFDDGLCGNHTHAFPVLQEYGFTGTLFLVEDLIGREHYLTEAMIAEMVAAGFEIGAHTRTHRDLTTLSDQTLRDETGGVKERLEERFGVEVTSLAYPAGAHDARVLRVVAEAGFLTAVTVRAGPASPEQGLLTLHRIRVNRGDGVAGLRRQWGGTP